MRQLLINPETNQRVQASIAGAEALREKGWQDASSGNAPSVKDFGSSGIIVQNLRASDYESASIERIHRFLQSGNEEYARGVLAYERSHQDRPVVVSLATGRLKELDAELSEDAPADGSERPAKSASREDWDQYAESIGVDPEKFSSKQDLIDAVDEAEQAA
jgi:hypothetical protein